VNVLCTPACCSSDDAVMSAGVRFYYANAHPWSPFEAVGMCLRNELVVGDGQLEGVERGKGGSYRQW
jgi:hypothetical protein